MAELRLGAMVDPAGHTRTETATTLPSEELTTHGVIVGMTGSGKTGLGVVLIEECLRAGIPALLIDPKGDLTNLALTFPNLAPAEFEPWVSPADAARAGQSVADFAAGQAARWGDGLAGWGLGAEQVRALHEGVAVDIYTPGAPHGRSLNIIGTLDVPADLGDPQAVQEEVDAYVSSLLNLLGIEADPLSSREHILLSTIIHTAWSQGRDLDLATLVAAVQQPPFRKVGVLELDSYYPPADRTKLALKLNGLLASPAFAAWLGGERIDIGAMLRGPDGRPRCAIVTTSHLSDEQRQSATSVILAKLISWMRRQDGTSDLRTLLYMDEVAGYLPPLGNPPTKAPIMLLLKQARAFGLGVVLSTQNPVDVDYKALSNAGTWMVGRLQTEQDKNRLLDGLASAAGTIDTAAVSSTISGLAKREFVLKRASRDSADVFTTRWAMSFLRGPLTRSEIASLSPAATPAGAVGSAAGGATRGSAATGADVTTGADGTSEAGGPTGADGTSVAGGPTGADGTSVAGGPTGADGTSVAGGPTGADGTSVAGGPTGAGGTTGSAPTTRGEAPGQATAAPVPAPPAGGAPDAGGAGADETPVAPTVAVGIPVHYLDPAASWAAAVGAMPGHRLVAGIIARVSMRFDDTKAGLVHDEEYEAVLTPIPQTPRPDDFRTVDYDDRDLLGQAPTGALYRLAPPGIATKSWWTTLQRALADHLYRSRTIEIHANSSLKLYSRVGETPEQFAQRCHESAQQAADSEIAALQGRYATKSAALDRRIDAAAASLQRQRDARTSSLATDVVTGLFGRRGSSWRAAAKRATTATQRVGAAQDRVEEFEQALADLQAELADEMDAVRAVWAARADEVGSVTVPLEKSDVKVTDVGLVWIPVGA